MKQDAAHTVLYNVQCTSVNSTICVIIIIVNFGHSCKKESYLADNIMNMLMMILLPLLCSF